MLAQDPLNDLEAWCLVGRSQVTLQVKVDGRGRDLVNAQLLKATLDAVQNDRIVMLGRASGSYLIQTLPLLEHENSPGLAFHELDRVGDELGGDLQFLCDDSWLRASQVLVEEQRLLLKPLHVPLLHDLGRVADSERDPG